MHQPDNEERDTAASANRQRPIRLPALRFTLENSADTNRVFLWTVRSEPPFMHPVAGWRIVGYGQAPWPKGDTPLAVMFEKVTPAERYSIVSGADEPEGTRIWQHGKEEWVPGLAGYEGRMGKANTPPINPETPTSE